MQKRFAMIQLELFSQTETQILRKEIENLKNTNDNLRRGLFKRYNELEKMVLELMEKKKEVK